MSNQRWRDDPRGLLFILARYKFVAKMLSGKKRVVEIGCADAFGTRDRPAGSGSVTASDFDPVFIDDARDRMKTEGWHFETVVHDILTGPVPPGGFDAAYSLDVFEHIAPEQEDRFVGNIARSLVPTGVAVIGSPSLQSQAYASEGSKAGHVNCKDGKEYRAVMERHFANVFLFSMNDEVVHTGFARWPITFSRCAWVRECLSVAEGGQIATAVCQPPLFQTPCFPDQLDSDCQRKLSPVAI